MEMLSAETDTSTLVRAIIARQPKGAYQKRLIKLAYLAEIKFVAEKGRRLSSADFFRYDHGPFSKNVLETAETLAPEVVAHEERSFGGHEGTEFQPGPNCEPPMSGDLKEFMDRFMKVYGRQSTEDITKESYRTKAFLDVGYQDDIDFEGWAQVVRDFTGSSIVQEAVHAALQKEPYYTCGSLMELQDFLRAVSLGRTPGNVKSG